MGVSEKRQKKHFGVEYPFNACPGQEDFLKGQVKENFTCLTRQKMRLKHLIREPKFQRE